MKFSLTFRPPLALLSLTLLVGSGFAARPAQAQFGTNLIVNGNAEAGAGSPGGYDVEAVPGFATTGNFTVVQYNAGTITNGFFEGPSDPGPLDRGRNYFTGGPSNASSSASQFISLSSESAIINAGGAAFTLSGYLGGYYRQNDNATLTATFLSAGNDILGTAVIGSVFAADRGDVNGLLLRTQNGFIPIGSQSVDLTLQMTRTEGSYNDGYADNLSFVVTNTNPVPEASTTVSFGLLLALGLGGVMVAARKKKRTA